MAAGDDDTVRIRPAPPPPGRRRVALWAGGAATLAVLAALAGWQVPRLLAPPPPPGPIPPGVLALPAATEAQILADRPDGLTLFRFASNPRVVVMDFASLREQGLMLNRVAAFAEKVGQPHDRVLTDAELDRAIRAHGDTVETFYYGHDYSGATLRQFFADADRDHVTLGPEEEHLRRIAAEQGLLDAGAQAAIISVPKEGADALVDAAFRRTILHHELSHGEYFSNPDYAAYARKFWDGLDPPARDAFRHFLLAQDYDPALSDLTVNEAQAYLMHTPDRRAFNAEALGLPEAVLNRLQAAFLLGMPPGWLRDCTSVPPLGASAPVVQPAVATRTAPRQRSTVRTRIACTETRPPRRCIPASAADRSRT